MQRLFRRVGRTLFGAALLLTAASAAAAQQPQTPQATAQPPALTQEQRALYVGVYETATPDGPMRIHIYEEGERLMGRPDGDDPSPLLPAGEHRFRPEMAYDALVTFTIENGRASRFTIVFPDERGTMTAVRTVDPATP